MHTIHTIPEADAFFASLPEGFDTPQDFAAALTPAESEAPVGYIPVAGTAGRTAAAALTAGILTAAGFRTGLYRAGAGPLSGRVTVDGQPLGGPAADAYLAAAGRILENTLLSRPAAELAAACACFAAAGCAFAVVEAVDGALASALPAVPVCAVTHIGPDGMFIAGEGEDEDMLRRLCSQLGVADRVTFCGWVSPVEPFFRAMDINLLSSVSETFPYSILEGICAGCATICSDVGGMPELIDTGENGYIFPVGDDKQLARYMARLANDAGLRRAFAEALYEKASRDFSRDRMCERQEANYRHLLARFHRPKDERESIVICGAYGRGNAGDDAILKAIVQEMRALDPERTICVMSRRPRETRLIYRTGAIYTFNVFAVLRQFRRAALYINGGGSLMQDVTSTRSIWYYCYTLRAAKKRGCKVMMYGCGIGPINRAGNRKMAARIIDRSVDRITLRDDNSRALLAEMGVTRPDIRVSADPTIILDPAPREVVNLALEQSGIDPAGRYIGFGLRHWKGLDAALPEIAAAANYAYEKHGLIPVFVPIEFPSDLTPAERVGALLRCPWHAVRTRQPIEVTIGILARMKAVVGIRLHSLMFSAGQGVPVVGMSYDIKVDGFLKYIGSHTCLQLRSVRADDLCRLIDECVSGALDEEVRRTAAMLREREHENVRGAARLLGLANEKDEKAI